MELSIFPEVHNDSHAMVSVTHCKETNTRGEYVTPRGMQHRDTPRREGGEFPSLEA